MRRGAGAEGRWDVAQCSDGAWGDVVSDSDWWGARGTPAARVKQGARSRCRAGATVPVQIEMKIDRDRKDIETPHTRQLPIGAGGGCPYRALYDTV